MPRFIRFDISYLAQEGTRLRFVSAFSIIVVFMFVTAFCVPSVFADRGLIPVYPDVSVYEPGQKAVVAWNGTEEILILSTDVTSSEQTFVVELLPLPSEPKVEAASFSSFETIQGLIWNEGVSLYYGRSFNDVKGSSVEIVFHEEIGAHNITVVLAADAAELVDWVEGVLRASGLAQDFSLGDFEPVVEDYMSRGYRYYVLDLVEVLPNVRSVDPILYRFESDFLYYPLVITSPVPGDTKITLFLLTNGKVEKDYSPLQKVFYQFPEGFKPIEFVLSKGELSRIDLRIGKLFNEMAWLTVLQYEGSPSWITADLMITEEAINPAATSEPIVNVDLELVFPAAIVGFFILLGGAITLAAVVCTVLILRIWREQSRTAKA